MPILLFILIVFSSRVFSTVCPYAQWDQTVIVKQVNDGDTITLNNGKRVRFIGINTPEINYRALDKSEPYALQAKALIEQYVRIGDPIHLVFDKTKYDKYGRILAYVYSKTGRNLSVLQLQSGFAKQWVIEENDRFWQCMQQAEEKARQKQVGIWSDFLPLQASALSSIRKGYQYISGQITALNRNKKGVLLTLDHQFNVWINNAKLAKFTANQILFQPGNRLLLTGKVFISREQLKMNLYHPVQVLEFHSE